MGGSLFLPGAQQRLGITAASPALASPAPHCLWVQGSAMGLSWLVALALPGQ